MTTKLNLDSNVTIGISAYGNHSVTLNCLRSIFASVEGDFELILVDDCSPDDGETLRLFKDVTKKHNNTKIISFTENKEYSGSVNAILSHAKGDYIFFISNDIYVTPSYFRTLIKVSNLNNKFGIVRGSSNFVDNGKNTHNVPILKPIGSLEDILQISSDIEKKFNTSTIEDEYLTGDAFMVRRSVIEKIGTFDTSFFGYFADHDFGLRAKQAGFKIILAQGAYAFHHQDSNFNYLPELERQKKLERRYRRIQESYTLFKQKYGIFSDEPYQSMKKIDWDVLANNYHLNNYYIQPVDYSKYIVPT